MKITYRPIREWPRKLTPHRDRKSPFRAGIVQTTRELRTEMRYFECVEVVVQRALREEDFRQDGDIRAGAKAAAHPGVILSFTGKVAGQRIPMMFACDDCDHWEDNLRAIVKTLEHLRGADRYGVTKGGEQYRGWNALPPAIITPVPMTVEEAANFIGNLLGMKHGHAILLHDAEMFRRNYRSAARRWHPDSLQGVQHPEWNKLQQAKEVLDRHHAEK